MAGHLREFPTVVAHVFTGSDALPDRRIGGRRSSSCGGAFDGRSSGIQEFSVPGPPPFSFLI